MTPSDPHSLRHASLCRQLSLLAQGRLQAIDLTRAYLDAIDQAGAARAAWVHVDRAGALRTAAESDQRRAAGRPLGRLDGIPIAIKDNLDVAGMPCSAGLAARTGRLAEQDAFAVQRLRGAGAVILGKTHLDEAAFGTLGRHPTWGALENPRLPGRAAGGSSSGSAVAVALGHASAALGSDTMGSGRIPAAFCGIFGLRPTLGEISTHGLWPALPRLDTISPLTRSLDDLTLLLQLLSAHDPQDPRSRRRRVPLLTPDWEPASLRCGVVEDLAALGVESAVEVNYRAAVDSAGGVLGQRRSVQLAPVQLAAARRRALLMMEAHIGAHAADWLKGASAGLQRMIDFARSRSAIDFAAADQALDRAVVDTRALFQRIDVLLLPCTPQLPPRLEDPEPAQLADLTAFASLAGCPALVLPMQSGLGLQLIGPPGSDLRLLELGEILAAVLDCAP